MSLYFGFAEAFGTPDQVDELDVYTINSFIIMAQARKEEFDRKARASTHR